MSCFISFYFTSLAQHQELNERPGIWKNEGESRDTQKLIDIFKHGRVSGHFRSFLMQTQNKGELKDDRALAMGGGLKFETAQYHGFKFGLSGVYVFDVASTDLLKPDPTTGQANRYEIGLFDLAPKDNELDVSRLEELYLSWKRSHFTVTLGKQHINTPFINLQDGRMRPTAVDGLWLSGKLTKNIGIEGGFIYGVSPRSTSRYFNVGSSIGLYPGGVTTSGQASAYKGKLEVPGIIYGGMNGPVGKQWKWQTWQMMVINLFYSSYYQLDFTKKVSENSKLYAAAQLIYQQETGSGGVTDDASRYMDKGALALTFGSKISFTKGNGTIALAYNRITPMGRYLMPREWGRDAFFTFMPRERNDGYGDVHAITLQWAKNFVDQRCKLSLAGGYFDLPDVKNVTLNKYGMPSYAQANVDVRYSFPGWLKGLEGQILYVQKWKIGENYGNDKFVYNKVDMSLLNVVLNFYF
ncbi:MAG: OprD family outer membrane porin [Saprospiraceae bacterium]|nr:OprD family outer membrane porin [Saprospiraceae bacterium]